MENKDGKVKELWGRQFRIVKNGLDEGEVFSFAGNLIEQNSEYAVKLENLESLTRLAESTVIQANKQAQQTLIEIDQQANETATAIISEAEDKAKTEADSIIAEGQRKAKLDAETILAKAEEAAKGIQEKAETVLAEAEKTSDARVSTAEQQFQDILEQARAEAEKTKAAAEEEAAIIISDARQEAEESARVIVGAADDQRQDVLRKAEEEAKEIHEKAEKEVLAAKREAKQLLARSKKLAEKEIRQSFGRIYQEMLSTLEPEDCAQTTATSIEEVTEPEPAQEEAVATVGADWIAEDLQEQPQGEQEEPDPESELETGAYAQEESTSEEPQETQASDEVPEEGSGEGTHGLYEGTVELQVPAPVAFDRMLQLHRNLRQISEIEEVNLKQPTDKGLTIELRLSSPIPLLKILGDLPEVDEVSDGPREAEAGSLLRRVRAKPHRSKIVVTTKQ